MSREGTVTLKSKPLQQLIKALKGNLPVARVGVLAGGKVARTHGGENNASILAKHEFGTEDLPIRSVLRVPLSDHLEARMEAAGAFNEEQLREIVRTGSILPFVEKTAVLAESVVGEAFDTAGFGKWPASNMEHKKVKQTLVETQQMRNAITSEVKG